MAVNLSMTVSGRSNISPAPSGWLRLTPNYCVAVPQKTKTAPSWASGDNAIDLSAVIPASAKAVDILITFIPPSLNVAGSISGVSCHGRPPGGSSTSYGTTGTGSITEVTALAPAGTELARVSIPLRCEVYGAQLINVNLAFLDNTTITSQSIKINGYWD